MHRPETSLHARLIRDAELLAQINVRRKRESDPGIFSSVEREILRREFDELAIADGTPLHAVIATERTWLGNGQQEAELKRIDAEIAASERALRDGSVPAADAALWHADWVAEKRLLEAEISRHGAPRKEPLTRIEAHADSGAYRGLIVAETPRHIVQHLPGHGLVAHKKESLNRSPRTGESVIVQYSNGRATVRDAQPRSKGKDLGRAASR
jgi:hypothetical protein